MVGVERLELSNHALEERCLILLAILLFGRTGKTQTCVSLRYERSAFINLATVRFRLRRVVKLQPYAPRLASLQFA